MAGDHATKTYVERDGDYFEDDDDVIITAVVSPSQELIFSHGFAELVHSILKRNETKTFENHNLSPLNQSKSEEPIIASHSREIPNEETVKQPEIIVDLTRDGWESVSLKNDIFW